ncbi:hypothetical protein U27_04116 [Candidatus Vecturithrix granuli]|uniref:Uncharacterized protein n=1 Tax=Vecturithrix granuli TaxID=1499967 RepID=A0A081BXU6_VECG1|nr:hypothetical protein U27_04116 [Candidatus Vecturithrix granuli]
MRNTRPLHKKSVSDMKGVSEGVVLKANPLPFEWKISVVLLGVIILLFGMVPMLFLQLWGRELTRTVFVIMGGISGSLSVLIMFFAVSRPVRPSVSPGPPLLFEKAITWILLYTPISAIIGLIHEWPLTYIIGDIFLLSILPLIFLALTRHPLNKPEQVFQGIYGILLTLSLFSVFIVFQHNVVEQNYHKLSLNATIPVIFYLLLKSRLNWKDVLFLILFVLGTVLTSKRANWGALIFAIGYAAGMRPGLRIGIKLLLLIAGLWGIILIIQETYPAMYDQGTRLLERRWEETMYDIFEKGGEFDPNARGRAGELAGLLERFRNSPEISPFDIIFGLGLGAMIRTSVGDLQHQIHATPAVFLARTGVIGLCLWLLFIMSFLSFLFRQIRSATDPWLKTQFLYWFGVFLFGFISSLTAQSFWGGMHEAVFIAYIWQLGRINASSHRKTKTSLPLSGKGQVSPKLHFRERRFRARTTGFVRNPLDGERGES